MVDYTNNQSDHEEQLHLAHKRGDYSSRLICTRIPGRPNHEFYALGARQTSRITIELQASENNVGPIK
jgi:hypothetical protein